MRKFVCSICGFIYDEATGYREGNVPPGTLWDDVPSTFVCPLCGASKGEFREKTESAAKAPAPSGTDRSASFPADIDYTPAELSALFSNLAKGSEKQYLPEMARLFQQLASYYGGKPEGSGKADWGGLGKLLQADLDSHFALANRVAGDNRDRGALRALKWSEQVTRMMNSHLGKLESGVPEFLEDTNVFVCEICGFIYVGDEKPEICPVCKVPSMKMTQIFGGVA